MASRKRKTRLPAKRTGLRSQQHELPVEKTAEELAWDTVPASSSSAEEEEISGRIGPELPTTSTAARDGELIAMMRDFLAGQQRRETVLLAELRGLRTVSPPNAPLPADVAGQQSPGPALAGASTTAATATPSTATASSPRMVLPTPARQREYGESPAEVPSRQSQGGISSIDPSGGEWRRSAGPKIPPYQMGEDIENYLLRFERVARTWRWPESEWACRLVPLLAGKALEAYTAMDEERAHRYEDLKTALLIKFDISPETYRQRFRSNIIPPGESPTETYYRLKGLYRRWLRPEQHTKDEMGEAIILEQLIRVLPGEVRTWVREHEPADGLAAAKLVSQYFNARKGAPPARSSGTPQRPPLPSSGFLKRESNPEPPGIPKVSNLRGAGKDFLCYYCQQPGHKASVCPIRKAKVTGACYAPRLEAEPTRVQPVDVQRYKKVIVNGQQVTALLDTGSFMSLIKQSLVPVNCVDYSRQEEVLCVHGDKHPYPKVEVTVTINEQPYLLSVGVVQNLPVEVILGMDLPVLMDLLQEEEERATETERGEAGKVKVNVLGPVVTRARAKAECQPLPDFDSSLCEGGTKGPRKSRRQRRFEKQLWSKEPDTKNMKWDVPENISVLQREDETLNVLFANVIEGGTGKWGGKEKFILDKNVLYAVDGDHQRLVIPASCKSLILHLAHTLPWAGHLGRQKTYLRVSSRFFWPSMYTDVQNYCRTCPVCQKTCLARKSDRALLQPLPIISTPFRRIAMDIVGPLVKSSRGHQYILVVCDYATRFPEAFPLRALTAPNVLRALVQLFSRVGIPDEILTDQGTNFTSKLMQLFHNQLGISAIRTSPYHPQTDGLVERFNQTLKRMLQKFVSDTGKDWDQWLPFLLFAYREVPQASTGFSPFELLYGCDVQGPLDLLRKGWETPASAQNDKGVVQFVLEMRDRLGRYQAEAEVNLRDAQRSQKIWYDQQARQREFQPGQKVLLLLPSSNSKLLAKWQGPYTILRRMGPVGHPIRQRPYRVPQHLVDKLRQEVEQMLELGVIEPSCSEWCSPVVIIFKKDGSLRICIDFRKLNAISEFDAYPMPRIEDLLEKIGAARYITTLDLCKGYWQVPLEESSRQYTAFRTPADLFQFTVMPFGLHGAPATFQRLMDKLLQGCDPYSAAYLDDVVIFSNTWEEHLQHLSEVLGRIHKAGLTLNPIKCEWARQETRYLGYQVGRGEVRPQMDKVEAIQNCPRPRTKKEVRSFLGLVGWYRRFVPQFATIAAPLTALTGKNQRNPVTWTAECEQAFQGLKTCLCTTPVLWSPDFKKRFLVQVDASKSGLGAVLAQGDPGEEHPVLYLSRKLLPRETNYSTVEKEALAIKWALEKLRYYLLGREFELETDHRALTWIQSMKDHNSRLTRWYLSLQPFRFTIRHRPGKLNVVADYLSRLPHIGHLRVEGDDVTELHRPSRR
ncbi:uncharacterized protein LOC120718122 [Simochromis diagramma]|uniref:uncharacterized protein LOC120718122 n=1 Tax=Simochromis diagramma TaxID=43689 RepID=UPI001A7E5337|nr:uncharacterized protein LOC120718122 [Simochromis diagramma]